jgi:hypothetical protein
LPPGFLEKKGAAEEWILRSDTKKWKETELAPELRAGNSITRLPSRIALLITYSDTTPPEIQVDRVQFHVLFRDYLDHWVNLVDTLLQRTVEPDDSEVGEQVDLVILTGGHSQWYWVNDLLTGALPGCGAAALELVRKDPVRIFSSGRPQETVARGMAMSGMANWFQDAARARQNRQQLAAARRRFEDGLHTAQLTALQSFVTSDDKLILMCRCRRLVENSRYTALLLTSRQLVWASKPRFRKCRSGRISWKDVTDVMVLKEGDVVVRTRNQTLRLMGFDRSGRSVSFDGETHTATPGNLGALMKLLVRGEPYGGRSVRRP